MIEIKVNREELERLLEAAQEALQGSSFESEGGLEKVGRWYASWSTPHFILRILPTQEGEAWRKKWEGE